MSTLTERPDSMTCEFCSTAFRPSTMGPLPRFCSDACEGKYRRRLRVALRSGRCPECERLFWHYSPVGGRRYCTETCAASARRRSKAARDRSGEWAATATPEKREAQRIACQTYRRTASGTAARARQDAKKRLIPGPGVTPDEWATILDRLDHRCYICSAPWQERDHVIPVSAGGSDSPENVRPVCYECNRGEGGKFARPLQEWLPSRLDFLSCLPDRKTPLHA